MEAPARIPSRYVALGDSSTEGLDDPYPEGGYRGWADRLAERIAELQPGLLYANLGVRGRLARQVHETQLAPALALRPELATVVAGMNDVLRPRCDVAAVAGHVEAMQTALVAAGATVLTFTLPDPAPIIPITRPLRPRLLAFNEALRAAAARSGAVLVDFGAEPPAADPGLWSADRLHASSAGHAQIAAALAAALGLPGADAPVADGPPALAARRRHAVLAAELAWSGRYLVPWIVRRVRRRSSGDGRIAKRPELLPVGPGPIRPG